MKTKIIAIFIVNLIIVFSFYCLITSIICTGVKHELEDKTVKKAVQNYLKD
mgnify:CR=1 FL=1